MELVINQHVNHVSFVTGSQLESTKLRQNSFSPNCPSIFCSDSNCSKQLPDKLCIRKRRFETNMNYSTLVICKPHQTQNSLASRDKRIQSCSLVWPFYSVNKMNFSPDSFESSSNAVERIKNEFNAGLDKLTFNCRNTIHGLTKYAESRIAHAQTIVDALEERIYKVSLCLFTF